MSDEQKSPLKPPLEADLRVALERDEFLLHYQPKIDLGTGPVIGIEALIRWQRPGLGLLPPAHFISAAEETGLIVPIGNWVLGKACAQNKAWQDDGLAPVRMAVNMSAIQFRDEGLATKIKKVLAETCLEPNYLELELTETALLPNIASVSRTISELRQIGVRTAIDNFGAGYSSLHYVRHIPADTLHLARMYIHEIAADAESAQFVSAVINIAHTLKLRFLAEGVETEEQLAQLRAHDCDLIQGNLFSKPLPADELAVLLREGRSL
jgi:EAL domain-containing protein (putative c-di-GMP-specific phosphodiesterase class I)